MPFKDISYLELWQPFCSAERKRLCNFVRGYEEDQFCEMLNYSEKKYAIFFLDYQRKAQLYVH